MGSGMTTDHSPPADAEEVIANAYHEWRLAIDDGVFDPDTLEEYVLARLAAAGYTVARLELVGRLRVESNLPLVPLLEAAEPGMGDTPVYRIVEED